MVRSLRKMRAVFDICVLAVGMCVPGTAVPRQVYAAYGDTAALEGGEDGQSENGTVGNGLTDGMLHRSADRHWYYIDRSAVDGNPEEDDSIVIVGRAWDVPFSDDDTEVVGTYIENGRQKVRFTIPGEIDGHRVSGLGNPYHGGDAKDDPQNGLSGLGAIDLVVVPEGVDTIYPYGFYDSGFYRIRLPESLKEIGTGAFWGDTNLSKIEFPDELVSVGRWAFEQTPWLQEKRGNSSGGLVIVNHILVDGQAAEGDIVIPSGVTKISPCAFYGNSKPAAITSVIVPDTVTEIGAHSFLRCSTLRSVTLGSAVQAIGDMAFAQTGIGELVLPDAVTEMGAAVCYACKGLKQVTAGRNLVCLSDGAFKDCTGLETVILKERMEQIGAYAFYNCTSLRKVVLPKQVKIIGESAFTDCVNLEEVTLPESLETIGALAFSTNGSMGSGRLTLTVPEKLTDITKFALWDLENVVLRVVAGGEVEACLKAQEVPVYQTYAPGMQSIPEGTKTVVHTEESTGESAENGAAGQPKTEEPTETVTTEQAGAEASAGSGATEQPKTEGSMETVTTEQPKTEEPTETVTTEQFKTEKPVETITTEQLAETVTTEPTGTVTTEPTGTEKPTETVTPEQPKTETSMEHAAAEQARTEDTAKPATTEQTVPGTIVSPQITSIDQSTTNIDQSVHISQNVTNQVVSDKAEGASEEIAAGRVFICKKCRYQINVDEKTVSFVGTVNKAGKVVRIPDTVTYGGKKMKVTEVGKAACRGKKLKKLVIGANVETIGEKAFYNCTALKTVVIGKRVETISRLAFYGDKRLKTLTFRRIAALKSVDAGAFYLKGKKTDTHLKAKQKSKKLMMDYLKRSGVKVKK